VRAFLYFLILFDKNSPWDELKIPKKGVVCQGKKPQDRRQEGGREGPLKGKEGSADIIERGISHPATAMRTSYDKHPFHRGRRHNDVHAPDLLHPTGRPFSAERALAVQSAGAEGWSSFDENTQRKVSMPYFFWTSSTKSRPPKLIALSMTTSGDALSLFLSQKSSSLILRIP